MSDFVRGTQPEESFAAEVAQPLGRARAAGASWAERPVASRLQVVKRTRLAIATDPMVLARTLSDRRPLAETLSTEVLPLLDAARFLERNAVRLLRSRRLGRRGRPLWLLGAEAEIRREPFGAILVLAPSNYPLFLPGVQAMQAIVAGNAVCVKPAPGCASPMQALAGLLARAGLPEDVLIVLGDSPDIGAAASRAGFDRIVLTGSAETARRVLRAAADRLTPCTMELSGNDPVFVLPGADLGLVADALAYGLRLNAGATCIAPRRVFVSDADAPALERALSEQLDGAAAVAVPPLQLERLARLLNEAKTAGARVSDWPGTAATRPIVVSDARPGLKLLSEDVFAPVLSFVPIGSLEDALAAASNCPYALGASIFGPQAAARALAERIDAGSVVINDLIVPTADPRLPFGGRRASGFGLTRGSEGLLEMTVCKTVMVRRGRFRPHLDPAQAGDAERLGAIISGLHGGLRSQLTAIRHLLRR